MHVPYQSVNERRAEVRKYATDKEYKKRIDEERKKAKPKKEDPGLSGIIIPLPPFGNSDMDNGGQHMLLAMMHCQCDLKPTCKQLVLSCVLMTPKFRVQEHGVIL